MHATCPAHLSSLDLRFIIMLGMGQVLSYGLDGLGLIPGVGGVEILLHSFVSRLVLGSTQPPIKLVPGNFSGGKGGRA